MRTEQSDESDGVIASISKGIAAVIAAMSRKLKTCASCLAWEAGVLSEGQAAKRIGVCRIDQCICPDKGRNAASAALQ